MVSNIQFKQLGQTFAAEVQGVDFSQPVPADVIQQIRDGIDKYGVLVFRGANINDDDVHVDFAKQFGPLESTPAAALGKKLRLASPYMFDLANIDHSNQVKENRLDELFSKGNEVWHADMMYHPRRTKYSTLRAVEIPPAGAGGDTLYADSRTAYDDLSQEMKDRIEGLVANCSLLHNRRVGAPELYRGVDVFDWPVSRWKIVYDHERTGRKNLYCTTYVYQFDGMSIEDSQKLAKELLDHATQDKYIYRMEWHNPGDMVMWDNTAVLHRATDGTAYRRAKHRRDVRRTSAWDDGPFAWGENDPNNPWVIKLPSDPFAEPPTEVVAR